MEWSNKVVVQIPLLELWATTGPVNAVRGRSLGASEIRALLRRGSVRFVVADLGRSPRWLPEGDCVAFWKSDVKHRLVDVGAESWQPGRAPGEYCYVATEWTGVKGSPIVVLEAYH